MARVKLRCIRGCPGLKSSYREKGLFITKIFCSTLFDLLQKLFAQLCPKIGCQILFDLFQKSFFQLYWIYYKNHLVNFV